MIDKDQKPNYLTCNTTARTFKNLHKPYIVTTTMFCFATHVSRVINIILDPM